ncbi:MAG: hypothetical protein ACOYT7_00115 [Patescibacteria group bacterium]
MKKSKVPSLVTIAILTTITVLFWVGFSVYRIFTDEPEPNVPGEILEPVSPTLDSETIDKIQGRIFFGEQEVQTQILLPSPTPTESPTASPTASPTPTPTPTPTATASALLL